MFVLLKMAGILGGAALVVTRMCVYQRHVNREAQSYLPKAGLDQKPRIDRPGELVESQYVNLRATTKTGVTSIANTAEDIVATHRVTHDGVVGSDESATAAIVQPKSEENIENEQMSLEGNGGSKPGRGKSLADFTTATPGRATKRLALREPGWEIGQYSRRQRRQRRTQAVSQSHHGHLPDGQQLEQQRLEQEDLMNNEAHDRLPEGLSLRQHLYEWPHGQAETGRPGWVQQAEPTTSGTIMYHEERDQADHQQARRISGHHAVVDADQHIGIAPRTRVDHRKDVLAAEPAHVGAGAVWSKLQAAIASQNQCPNPPCGNGVHVHTERADLGEEMSHVQGAVVVRRPKLAKLPGMLSPASHLDFEKTLTSYFEIFSGSLFPTRLMLDGFRLDAVKGSRHFIDAIADENPAAARYLSAYYTEVETPKRASDGYENAPTLVGIADVFINKLGYVWNAKDYVVPKSCKSELFGQRGNTALPTKAQSFEKVFVIAQHWGDGYFHFLIESLPRITVMLDILRGNPDIKIAVHAPNKNHQSRRGYMNQFMELLGVDRSRLVFVQNEIHADFAILPSSTACGNPDTQLVNMLRHALLQAMYPSTGGVPPRLPRPQILLLVRTKKRGLNNNNKVREALRQNFPSYDIVEFFGTGPILSQLQTFATASLIVAPHGAGLSNMVVSPLHTPILEIGPPECSACYLNLAVKLQHIYARHPASTTWNKHCESKYEPSVPEIIGLVSRGLIQGKHQADNKNPPQTVT
ncbi:unnamed protein product [Ectocarpus sp. 4 AP-2014]